MTFQNQKKTFLEKLDRSKKGSVDEKIIPLINQVNKQQDYYTTSSCSGRVYLWQGTGKKNETNWLKVSHDSITKDFFQIEPKGTIWLRVEGMIMHIACKDINAANALLQKVQQVCKKSNILSIKNKIIVEIRGSEHVEMPLYVNDELVFSGDFEWLTQLVNSILEKVWERTERIEKIIK